MRVGQDIDGNAQRALARRARQRLPGVACPFCGARAMVRNSEETTPTFRKLYYQCSDYRCSASWTASLNVDTILSPSGLTGEMRPLVITDRKPPGHDFGQETLFDHGVTRPPGTLAA